MTNNAKFRFQKQLMYRLKRDYGIRLTYNQPSTPEVVDFKTGSLSRVFTTTNIRRAVVLETRQIRDFEYDLSFIAANKNFTIGGFFDIAERLVILEIKDLPTGFKADINDHVYIGNRRYEIKEFNDLEDLKIVALKIKELVGAEVHEIHVRSVESVLLMSGEQS